MITDLSKLGFKSADDFGGKAAALGEMYRVDVPVVRGFGISVQEYRLHTQLLGIQDDIATFWTLSEAKAMKQLSANIASRLHGSPPVSLAIKLLEGLEVPSGSKLIVRSSATAEDSRGSSFAGQFLSVVCAAEGRSLAQAMANLWASATKPNVRSYVQGLRRPISSSHIDMALLV